MPHTYTSQLLHCVFSTKERRPLISSELQSSLWPYIGGIARKNRMKALSIGGTEDHIHMLLSLPSTMSIAKAIQLIKGGSSKWIHDTYPKHYAFAWQEGYGAFSIGISDLKRAITYIETQQEHHRRRDFKQEFLSFLKKHEIEYDEQHIWN